MLYGIFSDVHSNLEALEAVLQDISSQKVDRILCAGDLVGYGADPSACLERLQAQGVQSVCGNHDWAAAGKLSLDWFNPLARAAAGWTARHLSSEEKQFLGALPLLWEGMGLMMAHGSLHEPEVFHYLFQPEEALPSLGLQRTPVAFIGHTHLPGFFVQEGFQVRLIEPPRFRAQVGQKVLVNVGSVGQPRDGDPRAAWCRYDSATGEIEIRRVPYPVERARQKIEAAGLPEFLGRRLLEGY